ncbi:hypothetical protein [Paenibacillus sp. 32O-W]|uniref:hypothetical protein n=1 Tax=Paenibacillus sp. 32O-W TaxID=1695218 RepID=UPI00119CF3BE|nr:MULTISPECIES: hypothetical protein [Paenibacillaceae]
MVIRYDACFHSYSGRCISAANYSDEGPKQSVPTSDQAKQENNSNKVRPVTEDKTELGSVTILELDPGWFEKKTSEIPVYSKGDITHFEQAEVNSYNEGHSVTWGDPLVRTLIGISNLIPYDYLQDKAIDEQLSKGPYKAGEERKITTSNGIVFIQKQRDPGKTKTSVVEVQVPQWGTYLVTLMNGQDSDIQIIHKIVFTKSEG